MTSVSPSSPRFERINELQLMICYIKNKEMWGFYEKFEPTGEKIPAYADAEVNAIIKTLESELEKLLNLEDLIRNLVEQSKMDNNIFDN